MLKPLQMLQSDLAMFYTDRDIRICIPCTPSVPTIKVAEQRLLTRCDRLRNSLQFYCGCGNQMSFEDSFQKEVQVFEDFAKEIQAGAIRQAFIDVQEQNYDGIAQYLRLLEKVQEAYDSIIYEEDRIRGCCSRDWNRHLTDIDSLQVNKSVKDFALLIQFLGSYKPHRIVRGPAVSTSLLTRNHCYSYLGRNVGIAYQMTEDNLVYLSIKDAITHLTKLSREVDVLSAFLNWELIGDKHRLIVSGGSWDCFYPFEEFMKRWDLRIKNPDTDPKMYYNEILLQPNFEDDMVAIIFLETASDWEVEKATVLAQLFCLPLIKITKDFVVRIL